MIRALKALFELPPQDSTASEAHRVQLAAAALLIETARADFTQSPSEEAALEVLLCNTLALDKAEVDQLIELADDHVDNAISLYEFTREINDHYGPEQKRQLIAAMWAVAYADGDLDKYEEHLIRQVADLIYVPHRDYIKSKLAAKP
ncbi:MAG: TerB family tellurite resistance protein [Halieaceae bacterium]|jgi:uncharacterized tellurite resistance protein B-like protein|nr:TerB family tellurite resistance protein [Halieaceae bacterium]